MLMYESTQVKLLPATEWKRVVELVKRSNVNDGFGNVKYSGIHPAYCNSAHKRSRRSNIDCVERMPTIH